MSTFTKEYNNYIETLINIITVEKCDVKVLLMRKKSEPYKGYWILPGNMLKNTETLEGNVTDSVIDYTGLSNVKIEQCHTFSNLKRNNDERVIAISFLGLVDSKSVELKRELVHDVETQWFPIRAIPKTAYDHEDIINKAIELLQRKISSIETLKILFPSDFTLPELQKSFEQIMNKKIDRRNFRKKFIGLNLLEDTNQKNVGFSGRPAKLYKFKEDIKQLDLF